MAVGKKYDIRYVSGYWDALNRVLNYLNTIENKQVVKANLYSDIVKMSPYDGS